MTNLCLRPGDRVRDKFDRVGTVRRPHTIHGQHGVTVCFDNGTIVDVWQSTIREVLAAR